jgi:hypothetical protein
LLKASKQAEVPVRNPHAESFWKEIWYESAALAVYPVLENFSW